MNWDKNGRLWVVSSPLYPQIRPGEPETDKIVILEDEDGDSVAEKHTVFAVWSIAREHEARWAPLAENANPFDSVSQSLFAARALNKPVGPPVLLAALEAGEFSDDADYLSKAGSRQDLNALFEYALKPSTSKAHQQAHAGCQDIISQAGWHQQPADGPYSGPWTYHHNFDIPHANCPVLILDLNGDGRNDFI